MENIDRNQTSNLKALVKGIYWLCVIIWQLNISAFIFPELIFFNLDGLNFYHKIARIHSIQELPIKWINNMMACIYL